jgi:hypothetical protein
LIAAVVAPANDFTSRNVIGRLVGDVEEVPLFVEQELLTLGDVDLFADDDHAIRLPASVGTV